jgi:putative SOS response-associated peptidase YedK
MANSAAGAGARALDLLRWGLVPHWAKAIPNPPLINARAETIADKPSFRQALLKRRCVIPADAFYEWRAGSQPKQPYAIRSSAGGMLCFAGIWENWRQPNGDWLRSCAIITTAANTAMAALHDRMPAILAPEDIRLWLGDQPADPARVQALLRPCPDDWLEIYPVDPAVNRVGVDQPWFLDRVAG